MEAAALGAPSEEKLANQFPYLSEIVAGFLNMAECHSFDQVGLE
jgi:hypothetical protein